MSTLVSIRPNGQLVYLLNKLENYHRGATRTEIINRALERGRDEAIDWREVAEEKFGLVKDLSGQPQLIRFRAKSQAMEEMTKNIQKEFDLKVVQKPFLIKLALINYLNSIDLDLDEERFTREIKGDIWTTDPDDTEIAKKFYKEFWGGVLNQDLGVYRGDTIISFNTIAGGIIRLIKEYKDGLRIPRSSQDRLEIIKSSSEIPYSLKENLINLQKKYHCLANFMPLLKLEDRDCNLNYVKNKDYHDFPDEYFKDIKDFYFNNKGNLAFHEENNKRYFLSFGRFEEGYKNYIEENYLQDFFLDKDYKEVKTLRPSEDVNFPYSENIANKLKYEEREAVLIYTGIFLENALDIIQAREERFRKNILEK